MRLNLTLFQKGLILVAVPLAFELVFVSVLVHLLQQAEAEIQQERNSKAVIDKTNQFARLFYQISIRMKDLEFEEEATQRAAYQDVSEEVLGTASQLTELTAGHPEAHKYALRANELVQEADKLLRNWHDSIGKGAQLDQEKRFRAVRKGLEPLVKKLAIEIQALIALEKQIVEEEMPRLQADSRRRVQTVIGLAVAFNIFVAVFLAAYFNRATVSRLKVLMDNTQRLAGGRPLNPPLPGRDEIAHLDKVFNDMAQALQAAMRKERAIVENAMDIICAIGEDNRFTAVSPACQRVLGYLPAEMIGCCYEEFVFDSNLAKMRQAVDQLRDGSGQSAMECRMKRKDGGYVEAMWSAQWSPPERTLYCVIHDITDRKQIEQMKQDFLAMVSHDLRTPLTSIQASTTLLLSGIGGEMNKDGREILQMADQSASRLISLINDLLDVEKMESGKLQMRLEELDLQEVFDQAEDAVQGFADLQKVTLRFEPTRLAAIADGARLIQVVVNLVANAIKFSSCTGNVTVRAIDQGEFVEIQVVDQGRGIPEEHRKAIFEKFQQVSATDATEKKGSGLGLAICKGIIEAHGGSIGVESEEGKGSTFWFRVKQPAQTAEVEELEMKAEAG